MPVTCQFVNVSLRVHLSAHLSLHHRQDNIYIYVNILTRVYIYIITIVYVVSASKALTNPQILKKASDLDPSRTKLINMKKKEKNERDTIKNNRFFSSFSLISRILSPIRSRYISSTVLSKYTLTCFAHFYPSTSVTVPTLRFLPTVILLYY